MPAYDKKAAKKSKAFKSFKKYVLRGKRFSKRQKLRLFFSKAEGTIKAYTKIIRGYVKYMHRKEHAEAYPITETSLRRYIDTLSIKKDRTKFPMMKPAIIFAKKCWNEPEITFSTSDLTIEGALREAGARFRPPIKTNNINELNIRKFILRCLYGKSFKQPYNENLAELRTGLRCLTSLHTLSRCEDYRVLKKSDIKFENGDVLIFWRKRKNNQRSKLQQSLVPSLPDHPLCLYNAFYHFFEKTQLTEDQFINCKLKRNGRPNGNERISRATCYQDINKICNELKIDRIKEKMCKALGTRYTLKLYFTNTYLSFTGSSLTANNFLQKQSRK